MDTFVTKAARLNGPRDIELIERELVCGEDDIIVKIYSYWHRFHNLLPHL
mgnify:CR=1 FL=1